MDCINKHGSMHEKGGIRFWRFMVLMVFGSLGMSNRQSYLVLASSGLPRWHPWSMMNLNVLASDELMFS